MILTTSHNVYCDTFNTNAEAKMHEVELKEAVSEHLPNDKVRKLQLTITGKDGKQQISLWREDVILLSKFLEDISDDISCKL